LHSYLYFKMKIKTQEKNELCRELDNKEMKEVFLQTHMFMTLLLLLLLAAIWHDCVPLATLLLT
jgi:hypothetical protein